MELNTCWIIALLLCFALAKKTFMCGDLWDINTDTEAQKLLKQAVDEKDRIGLG